MDYSSYNAEYSKIISMLEDWRAEMDYSDAALRKLLEENYDNKRLDPDKYAVRTPFDIKCTADALLSMHRICKMETSADTIIETYKKYRKRPIFYFPCENGGINQARASKNTMGDRIDYTLFDLKRFFDEGIEHCTLKKSFTKPLTAKWLASMGSFENIIDWYGVRNIFTDSNYNIINIETGTSLQSLAPIANDWSLQYYENVKWLIDQWYKANESVPNFFEYTSRGTKSICVLVGDELHVQEYTLDGSWISETICQKR